MACASCVLQRYSAFWQARGKCCFKQLACSRWQALSRSLERVTAVHGDEGDDQHGLKVHEVHDMQPGMPSGIHHSGSPIAESSTLGSHEHGSHEHGVKMHEGHDVQPGNNNHSGSFVADTSTSSLRHCQPAGAPDTAAVALTTRAPELSGNTPRLGAVAEVSENMEQPQSTCPAAAATAVACDEPIIDLCSLVKSRQHVAEPQHDQQDPSQAQQPLNSQACALTQPASASVSRDAPADDFPELRANCPHFGSLSQAGKASMAALHDLRPAGVHDDQPTQPPDAVDHADAAHQSHCFPAGASADAHLAAVAVNMHSQQQQQLDAHKHLLQEPAPNQPTTTTSGNVSTQPLKIEHQAEPLHTGTHVLTDTQTGQKHDGQKPSGLHDRMKGLLRRQEGVEVNVGAGADDIAQPLTQAEVIEAQTTDEEKPMVCSFPV